MEIASQREALISKLSDFSGRDKRRITEDTEVFYDLGVWGDDFDELIETLVAAFGVDFSDMNYPDYAPGEPGDLVPRFVDRWFGHRPYKSLQVRDLLQAIAAGRWEEAA